MHRAVGVQIAGGIETLGACSGIDLSGYMPCRGQSIIGISSIHTPGVPTQAGRRWCTRLVIIIRVSLQPGKVIPFAGANPWIEGARLETLWKMISVVFFLQRGTAIRERRATASFCEEGKPQTLEGRERGWALCGDFRRCADYCRLDFSVG